MRPFYSGSVEAFARLAPGRKRGVELAPRRLAHGGGMSGDLFELRQPQDGAPSASEVEGPQSPIARGPFSRLNEPEDARMTGSTRSLGRRLLGLNIVGRSKPAVRDLGRALLLPGAKAQVA